MKINIYPKVMKIALQDKGTRLLESYINACVMKCHGECNAKKCLNAFSEWIDEVIKICHADNKHEPEYCVVKHKLDDIRRKYLGERNIS